MALSVLLLYAIHSCRIIGLVCVSQAGCFLYKSSIIETDKAEWERLRILEVAESSSAEVVDLCPDPFSLARMEDKGAAFVKWKMMYWMLIP